MVYLYTGLNLHSFHSFLEIYIGFRKIAQKFSINLLKTFMNDLHCLDQQSI